eukprot:sb/3463774/
MESQVSGLYTRRLVRLREREPKRRRERKMAICDLRALHYRRSTDALPTHYRRMLLTKLRLYCVRLYCVYTASILRLYCVYTASILRLYCVYTASILRLYCVYTASILRLYCVYTASILRLYCVYTASILRLYCVYTASILRLYYVYNASATRRYCVYSAKPANRKLPRKMRGGVQKKMQPQSRGCGLENMDGKLSLKGLKSALVKTVQNRGRSSVIENKHSLSSRNEESIDDVTPTRSPNTVRKSVPEFTYNENNLKPAAVSTKQRVTDNETETLSEEEDEDDEKMILDAIRNGDYDNLEEFLNDPEIDANEITSEGRRYLHECVTYDDTVACDVVLEAGGHINARDIYGWTALHYAAAFDLSEMVQYLLDRQADPRKKNKDGNTPDMMTEEPDIQQKIAVSKISRLHRRSLGGDKRLHRQQGLITRDAIRELEKKHWPDPFSFLSFSRSVRKLWSENWPDSCTMDNGHEAIMLSLNANKALAVFLQSFQTFQHYFKQINLSLPSIDPITLNLRVILVKSLLLAGVQRVF